MLVDFLRRSFLFNIHNFVFTIKFVDTCTFLFTLNFVCLVRLSRLAHRCRLHINLYTPAAVLWICPSPIGHCIQYWTKNIFTNRHTLFLKKVKYINTLSRQDVFHCCERHVRHYRCRSVWVLRGCATSATRGVHQLRGLWADRSCP